VILDIETAARAEFVRVEYDVDEALRGIRASDLPSDFAEFVVAATGHLGGAHVNPAVTIALWSVRRFPAREVVPYVLAQCGGAAVAAFVLRWILGPVGNLGATLPALSLGRALRWSSGTPRYWRS